jgi:hypothetical protein
MELVADENQGADEPLFAQGNGGTRTALTRSDDDYLITQLGQST